MATAVNVPAGRPLRTSVRLAGRQSQFAGSATLMRPVEAPASSASRKALEVSAANAKELRDRINSVKNTQKITDAMKLVSAAKVRRAQTAVVNGRPFSQNLVQVLFGLNGRLKNEDVEVPLTKIRPVKKVLVVSITGDRGLCGGYNNYVFKKVEARLRELRELGVDFKLLSIGKKGNSYFGRRPAAKLYKALEMGQAPNTRDAQAIADEIYSEFVAEEVDKVELVYTKFVSLIASEPVTQTLLPMSAQGEVCDVKGRCVDAADDEMFKLTSAAGKMAVEREKVTPGGAAGMTEGGMADGSLIFEQDPEQILDALLPLYMNSQILRALQESLASELAARMNAMSNASDNAKELKKNLTLKYNRGRQAAITNAIIEVVSGSSA